MAPRHVVLVGLMGSGKTTVGARVAALLGLPFRDGDMLLEAATGMTAAALHHAGGHAALQRAECDVLLGALDAGAPTVIAAAAAVVDDAACRTALRAPGIVVALLRADSATLGRRFAAGAQPGGEGTHRPEYGQNPSTFLAGQARRRAARFAACRPRVAVDTGVVDPEPAAAQIATAVRAAWSAPAAGAGITTRAEIPAR